MKKHLYGTVLYDLDNSTVLDIVQGRKTESCISVLQALPLQIKDSIQAVAMDMYDGFIKATKTVLPGVSIVHDKFHIVKHMNEAIDSIRRRENKLLSKQGIDLLKGTKFLLLKNVNKLNEDELTTYEKIKEQSERVGKACSYKEILCNFWDMSNNLSAKSLFLKWYKSVIHSGIAPIIRVARMLHNRLEGVLNYFKYKITNAIAEGINSKIQLIKSNARGYRNFDNYRYSILFHCGGL